jgi:hypothetical protein
MASQRDRRSGGAAEHSDTDGQSPDGTYDPGHWLERAVEARALGDGMSDPTAKRAMEQIARGYERMAAHADRQARRQVRLAAPPNGGAGTVRGPE